MYLTGALLIDVLVVSRVFAVPDNPVVSGPLNMPLFMFIFTYRISESLGQSS